MCSFLLGYLCDAWSAYYNSKTSSISQIKLWNLNEMEDVY